MNVDSVLVDRKCLLEQIRPGTGRQVIAHENCDDSRKHNIFMLCSEDAACPDMFNSARVCLSIKAIAARGVLLRGSIWRSKILCSELLRQKKNSSRESSWRQPA